MNILIINSGSSSLKYQLINTETNDLLCKGLVERIGMEGSQLIHTLESGEKVTIGADLPDHNAAIKIVLDTLLGEQYGCIKSVNEIGAVGHRVVHGGENFNQSVIIDDKVIKAIEDCIPLAPIHNPPNLTGIRSCMESMPGIPNVAVFDTAFHQTMDETHYLYPIPYEYYKKYKIRKYGFHGTSHKYVAMRCAKLMNTDIDKLRIITIHLGNGSSVAAVKYGQSIDTSMGFTPLSGLMMGTRSGDIDPAIVTFLSENENMSCAQVNDVLNKKSGLLGISEISNDFRDLYEATLKSDAAAKRALDIFFLTIKKFIGIYSFYMGGVDAIVFTAGIGENNAYVRTHVTEDLAEFGIEIDEAINTNSEKEKDISKPGTKVKTWVIPTNEELMIATETYNIVK